MAEEFYNRSFDDNETGIRITNARVTLYNHQTYADNWTYDLPEEEIRNLRDALTQYLDSLPETYFGVPVPDGWNELQIPERQFWRRGVKDAQKAATDD